MRVHVLSLVALVLSSVSCVELTPVRRTALVPTAYAPARIGAPLAQGQTSLSGEYSSVESPTLSDPALYDPGLLIPDLYVGGHLYHGFTDWLELGVQLRYSSFHQASPNIEGVLPFPKGASPDLWMYGAGIRINEYIPGTKTTVSTSLELNGAKIYQTRFICGDRNCNSTDPTDLADSGLYVVEGFDVAQEAFGGLFLSQSTALTPELYWFTLVGAERHHKNNGFDLTNEHNPLYDYLIGIVGSGVSYNYRFLSSTLTIFFPFSDDPAIDFGPALQLQTGLRF